MRKTGAWLPTDCGPLYHRAPAKSMVHPEDGRAKRAHKSSSNRAAAAASCGHSPSNSGGPWNARPLIHWRQHNIHQVVVHRVSQGRQGLQRPRVAAKAPLLNLLQQQKGASAHMIRGSWSCGDTPTHRGEPAPSMQLTIVGQQRHVLVHGADQRPLPCE
jgi:hypothetical protein